MVQACLLAGAHYLDITGEIEVFEAVLARDAEARERGSSSFPGLDSTWSRATAWLRCSSSGCRRDQSSSLPSRL